MKRNCLCFEKWGVWGVWMILEFGNKTKQIFTVKMKNCKIAKFYAKSTKIFATNKKK
jgi:hypothetical protein